MTIERIDPQDLPELLELVRLYWGFEDLPGFSVDRLEPALASLLGQPALGCGWIARRGGQSVAYLLAVYVFSLEHAGLTAEIDEFFVLPQHRDQGIGAELLVAAEAEFRCRKCANISLQIGTGNEAARAFYARHGFAARSGFSLLEKNLG